MHRQDRLVRVLLHPALPVYSCYGYSYSQQLYTSAELTAAIGTTNTVITKVGFTYPLRQQPVQL
jgi:hypothetical protein